MRNLIGIGGGGGVRMCALVCSGLVGLAIDYTIKHGPLANGYLLTLASKMCPHKMAGQLESYMVGEPMPMAHIHSVFR